MAKPNSKVFKKVRKSCLDILFKKKYENSVYPSKDTVFARLALKPEALVAFYYQPIKIIC
ncbi:hypothetical protein SPFL3101_02877 [Sporomusaceae bacterium FL31]|nr:hypothetical protein SPFL3101_02877 [Sporomusaceae bacterium FL31]